MVQLRRLKLALCLLLLLSGRSAAQEAVGQGFWKVDDVRAGLKGYGKTVVKGIKIERFEAEVLGVLRNSSPGRDLILCQLSGLNLEKTGVIAGMSGSPIYIDNKLLGAVAYAWQFGKEPIAGVTPFVQMRDFVTSYEKRDLAEKAAPRRIGLQQPLLLDGQPVRMATIADDFDAAPAAADGLWLTPLRTPVSTTGFSARSLAALREPLAKLGMVAAPSGGVSVNIPDHERNIPIEAGGALSVGLVTGDFDMSGIGTVTHVEGKRVYGWGHPFMSLGNCEFPLMTGYVHTIYPRLNLSFKMGSPLRSVGVINADVSTCIAGWLDKQPNMLPMSIQVQHQPTGESRTFNLQVVRQPQLLPGLVQASLVNAIDMEGDLSDESTTFVKVCVELEQGEPLVYQDMLSGPAYSGAKGASSLFAPLNMVLHQLQSNTFRNVPIKNIQANIELHPARLTAEIESAELENDVVAPGESVKAMVTLRPFKGPRQRVALTVPLPADLADGTYSALIGDGLNNVRAELRDNPHLNSPMNFANLSEGLQMLLGARRTELVLRVPHQGNGVVLQGNALPDLPASMVQMLSSSRRSPTQVIQGAWVARQQTNWVLSGAETLRFQVSKNKKNSL